MTAYLENSRPRGWAPATIGQLIGPDGEFTDGDWVESKDQDPHGDVRLIQLADVGDGTYQDRSSRFLTSAKAAELRCTFLRSGDVLVARMPDPLGRACIFPGDKKECITVVDVCIVRTGRQGPHHRWLMWFVNSPQFRNAIASLQSGSTRKRISRGNLATLSLPIPPLNEQERIADEVEKHLTRLDAAVTALRRVQANLKRYRASVLKAACEGRLVPTEAELARREGRSYEPASALLDRIRLADPRAKPLAPTLRPADSKHLPEGWIWTTFDQLLNYLRNGISTKPDAESGQPILRISAVRPMKVDLSDVRFLGGNPAAYSEYIVEDGDLLFTRYNGNPALTGVCGLVRSPVGKIAHPDKLIRAKVPRQLVDPRFLEVVLNAGVSRRFIESRTRTTAGQSGISGSDLRSLPVPLAPFSEQQRIATEAERRLSIIDELQAEICSDEERAERLRQSILKRAFEGKLVPQDPNDEPSSVLLERIRGTAIPGCAPSSAPKSRQKPAKRKSTLAALSS